MFDARLRPLIDPPLAAAAVWLVARGIRADHVTSAGFALGVAAAGAIAVGEMQIGLALILLNRAADGLDGAVARATQPSDRGGFIDIVLDFVFYAAIPLAFALYEPKANGLPAALLLASFLANGTAFLAFAVIAGKQGLATEKQGKKSFFFVAGLAEGAETVAAFCCFCLWPSAFPWLAGGFAAVCAASAAARIYMGWCTFR